MIILALETCPICDEEFEPVWENKKIKCDKCKSEIKMRHLDEIEKEKLKNLDKVDLAEFVDELTSRLQSLSDEYTELENRVETLGIVIEQGR